VKPPQPINPSPFLTLITPTFRRPKQLASCLQSVGDQTAADQVQHIVIPDHVGHGVPDGLFGRLPTYVPSVIGHYVNMLCDDDVLASETVVSGIQDFAARMKYPPVIVAYVRKGPLTLPLCNPTAAPICGQVDLTSYIVRTDVWKAHVKDYGRRYEGDFDHTMTLFKAGYEFAFCPTLWAIGAQSNGRPEA
jgi:hypothetical protein